MAAVRQARNGASRQIPGGREARRAEGVPARGARRVWGRAVAGTLSAAGLAAASLSLALVLAVPGGPAGATSTHAKAVKVSTAKVAGVGTVLTTASGLTLYRFTEDTPGTSMCSGACAKIWPPLLAAKGAHVSGPHGVKGFSLVKLTNGHWQVAFHKLPLYTFQGDKKKGQAHGQNVGMVWFAVLKSGIPASNAAPTSSTTPTTPTAPTTAGSGTSTTQPPTPTTQVPGSSSTPAPAVTPTTRAPAPPPTTTPPTQPKPPPTTTTTTAPITGGTAF
jgi:predicted lipoprotein with Yx(FWY)xxD motif